MFEVQLTNRPDSPLSGVAACEVRLDPGGDGKVRIGAGGVENNAEKVFSSMFRSDMMTTSENDNFCADKDLHTSGAMRSAHECNVARTQEKCACCARLMRCAVHSARRVLGGSPSEREDFKIMSTLRKKL